MLHRGPSSRGGRIRGSMVVLVLVVGTAFALLVTHAPESSQSGGFSSATVSATWYASGAPSDHGAGPELGGVWKLAPVDSGLACLALAPGCVALLLAIIRGAPAVKSWLRLLPAHGQGTSLARSQQAASLLTATSILRV